MHKILDKTAKIISIISHPAFMPLVGFYIFFNSEILHSHLSDYAKNYTYIIVVFFSILLPLSFFPLLLYWKIINSVELKTRRERFFPLLFYSCSVIIMHILLKNMLPLQITYAYTLSIAIASLLLLFLNILVKASMHLLGIGGVSGLIIALKYLYSADMFTELILVFIIAGLAASARLYLKAHSLKEIVLGYFIGFACVLFTMVLKL